MFFMGMNSAFAGLCPTLHPSMAASWPPSYAYQLIPTTLH